MRAVILSHTFLSRKRDQWLTKDRVAETVEEIARSGWRVTYVARASTPQSFLRHPLDQRIAVIAVGKDGSRYRDIVEVIRSVSQADAVLVFMPTVRTAFAAVLLGKRCVIYAGNAWSLIPGTSRWRAWLEAAAARRAGAVIAAGASTHDRFKGVSRNVSQAVPMVASEAARRLMAEEPEPAVGHSLNVLFVGSLVRRKGLVAVIEAVKAVPEARCRIIGPSGDDEGARRALTEASEHPRFDVSDYVEWPRLREAYIWADVLCLPSAVEGFPRVLYEAAAFDTALVVSPVGGIPDRLTDRCDAIFVPPGDATAVADALRRLQQDPAYAGRLAASAHRSLRRAFAYESTGQQLAEALRRIAEDRKRVPA